MLVALVIAACGTTAAGGHDNSCHQAHTCPADDHSYEWNGMSCTSDPAQRLPADQTPVTYDGIQYWCHTVVDQGMTPGPTGTPTQPTASPGAPCTSRAATVGMLADAGASGVRLAPLRTSIAHLSHLHAPASLGPRRTAGAERRVYRVRGRLVSARRAADGTWTVVLAAGPRHLAVAFPAGVCAARAATAVRTRIAAARRALVRACHLPSATGAVRLHGVGTIDGVGYFDADRAALKLRPVLRLTSVRC